MVHLILRELRSRQNLITVPYLQRLIETELAMVVKRGRLRLLLRKKLGLRVATARQQEQYVNSKDNIYLRKLFAIELIKRLRDGAVILNFDERVISGSTGKLKTWL